MANKKISELDSRASLSLSDLLAVGDPTTGYLYKITITDLKTLTGAGVISFNGRVGSVTPAEGDYNLTQLGDVIITTAINNDVLRYNGSNWVNAQIFTGTIAQYVDGTGAYQTFPTLLSSDRLITEVRNTTGATVTKGTVIYLNGSSGTLPLIAKAQANGEATSTGTYGVVQNDIANNANGYVVVIGNLTGIDTSAYSAGAILWLSPTVAGGYTTTKPSAPNHAVYIGIVTRSSNTQGTIEVKIQNGYELDELHNVSISSVANNEVLVYESASSLWKNKTIPTILGYTPANAATYVPYTGATADMNIGAYSIYTSNVIITSGGSGFLAALTADTLNAIGILNLTSGGKNGNLKPTTLGADRTWTLPDASGTIALTSNLSSYVPTSRTLTINGTTYDLSADRSWTISTGISGSGVSGRISFFDGTSSVTSDSNLSWDNTSKFISTAGVYVFNNTTNAYMLTSNGDNIGSVFNVSATRWGLGYGSSTSSLATAVLSWNNSGNVSIGNTNNTYNLDVTGTLRNTTSAYFATSNGDVAIGTTTAINYSGYNTLTINGNTNGGVLAIRNPSANGINISAASSLASIDAIGASTPIVLNTAGSERMRITSAGKVGIGTTSPVGLLQLNGSIANSADAATLTIKQSSTTYTNGIYLERSGERTGYFMYIGGAVDSLTFRRNWNGTQSDVMSLTRDGNVLINATTSSYRFQINSSVRSLIVLDTNSEGFAGTTSTMYIGTATTGRSINAGGTINASGADYAEYMVKADETVIFEKGDIVGVNANGKLTDIFSNANSFVIKSTDPSYVGGDNWFKEMKPGKEKNQTDVEYDESVAAWEAKYQKARLIVDRIAFSGQVPCNVKDANVGDYIIPINDNGKIKGIAVKNPTLDQYQIAVGKVWKIMDDGRAWVAIKIG